jgi:hypothetical protein
MQFVNVTVTVPVLFAIEPEIVALPLEHGNVVAPSAASAAMYVANCSVVSAELDACVAVVTLTFASDFPHAAAPIASVKPTRELINLFDIEPSSIV